MRISSFTIRRFKSIEYLNIPIINYGKGKHKSSVAFLVGLNESGKSSILEAISLWFSDFDGKAYDDYYHKGSDEDGSIRIEANIEVDDVSVYQSKIAELLKIEDSYAKRISLSGLTNITWCTKTKKGNFYSFQLDQDFPLFEFIYSREAGVEKLKDKNSITEEITEANASSFLKQGQTLLTKQELEDLIRVKLYGTLNADLPTVNSWRAKPEYLINETIDLKAFASNPDISIPLKNIFHIKGLDTNEKIKASVEKALLKPENKAELQKSLSKAITLYINKIWKEHKINIIVNIDADQCNVHVEDKDKEYKYYSMNQRSDGFNQFISLILSLSAQNDNDGLSNNIILLDEPEAHLHPSGVRYMRDELLKIGKNNILFVSTHSHYMVDTSTPERHYIVSKKEMKTNVVQIEEDTSMSDDQVLASAFGLNLFKELLPQNILVVEGGDDKEIISHALDLLNDNFFYSIKSAGGASKVYGIASLLATESIPAYIILDDDKEGRDAKKNILSELKENYSKENVITIRDLSPAIVEKGSLEDSLPFEFVKTFFEEEMGHPFQLEKDLPLIFQIKNLDENLKNNKEQLASKKIALSKKFTEKFNSKDLLEEGAPKLVKLVKELVLKIKQ